MCGRESCAVSTCCEAEIPLPWRYGAPKDTCIAVPGSYKERRGDACGGEASNRTAVDFTLLTKFDDFETFESDVSVVQGSTLPEEELHLPAFLASSAATKASLPTLPQNSRTLDAGHMEYVNLRQNPERYTGYTGHTATRIWDEIYNQNCFVERTESTDDQCYEERIMYKLLSGLHTSINTQLCRYFYPGDTPNLLLWQHKVGLHADRLQNLYFTFLFVSRATTLAIPHLRNFNYATNDPATDVKVGGILERLAETELLRSGSAPCFNESLLFAETYDEALPKSDELRHMRLGALKRHARNVYALSDAAIEAVDDEIDPKESLLLLLQKADEERRRKNSHTEKKQQFISRFRNTSLILDCVSCEKCKLWGKLQVLGIGTALKILLSEADGVPYDLERNEIVALFNTLTKLSSSVETTEYMSALLEDPTQANPTRIFD